jgi:hypothetical protein
MTMEIDWYKDIPGYYGPPQQARKADPAYAETWRGRVPDWLIRFWVDYGWGSWRDGAFWICDPALLEPVRDAVLEGDPLIDPARAVLFAYTAFGDVLGFHPEIMSFDINWHVFDAVGYNDRQMRSDPKTGAPLSMAALFGGAFSTMNSSPMDDENGDALLPQAIERLGRLEPGEIYGFFPALKMGGENRVENLKRVPIVEHCLFLSQLGRLWLHEYYGPRPGDTANPWGGSNFLRRLGPQG